MLKPSTFNHWILAASLCGLTAGCSHGFWTLGHSSIVTTDPVGVAVATAPGSSKSAAASSASKDPDRLVHDLAASPPRETRLAITNVTQGNPGNRSRKTASEPTGVQLVPLEETPLSSISSGNGDSAEPEGAAPLPPDGPAESQSGDAATLASATVEVAPVPMPPQPRVAAPHSAIGAAEPQPINPGPEAAASQPEPEPLSPASAPATPSQATNALQQPTPEPVSAPAPAASEKEEAETAGPAKQPGSPKPTVTPPAVTPPAAAPPAAPKQPSRAEAALPNEPVVQSREPAAAASVDANSLITLHVDNTEVNKVLEMVTRQANLTLIAPTGVTDLITLHIKNKPLDETLRIIANQCHLTIRRDRDVIYVTTQAEVRRVEGEALPVRVYHLSYVNSGDVLKMIKDLLTPSVGKITQSPDSAVGLPTDIQDTDSGGSSGSTTEVKNAGGNSLAGGETLIVQDYEAVLQQIDKVIAQIDIQPVQVLIEAVIVQVSLDKNMELGVNFALLDGAGSTLGVVGSGAAINAAAGFNPASVLTTGGKLVSGFATDTNGVKFGWTGSSTTGFIRALEGVGETTVLASTRIGVLNKQRAELHVGKNLGYYTTNTSQTTTTQTVQYLKIGTQLRLRPFVYPNGMIRMEVHPERSTGALDDQGIPQTSSAQVTTNVMIPEGATMMIGGLIDDEITQEWEGIPFLSRIPFAGYLFRHTIDKKTKKELVVLLTPHVCNQAAPEQTNYLGAPRTLNLEKRVAPRAPFLPCPGEESLYEVIAPQCN